MKQQFILMSLIFCIYDFGLGATNLEAVDKTILNIIQKAQLPKEQLSLEIVNGTKKVFSLNSEKQMIPASVTKIVTSYAALKTLPANYKFTTELYSDGKDLFLKGGGDPSFVSEKMWYLVNELTRQNQNLYRDIIVDDTIFDEVRFDTSRETVRVDRSYDAPVGGMSFNWNSVNIFVKPGENNRSAFVVLDPENTYFQLTNKTKTVSGRGQDLIIEVNQSKRQVLVKGQVGVNSEEKAYFKNVAEPLVWSGDNLKSFLKQRGIIVTGKIKSGLVPGSAKLVAKSEGKSLAEVLLDMNKFSNNYIAEMLIKNISAYKGHRPATLDSGMKVLRSLVDEKQMHIENPSGFSRENKLSAASLVAVLENIRKDFSIYPSLVQSLPIAGLDGTLKKRMKDTVAEGRVRAKTGYLDGVVSLAGYAGLQDGEILTFSFLYNGPHDEAKVRETFDQILISLLK